MRDYQGFVPLYARIPRKCMLFGLITPCSKAAHFQQRTPSIEGAPPGIQVWLFLRVGSISFCNYIDRQVSWEFSCGAEGLTLRYCAVDSMERIHWFNILNVVGYLSSQQVESRMYRTCNHNSTTTALPARLLGLIHSTTH